MFSTQAPIILWKYIYYSRSKPFATNASTYLRTTSFENLDVTSNAKA